MTVNYGEWEDQDRQKAIEQVSRALDEARKGRRISPTLLSPELGLTSEDRFTRWHPSGSPDRLRRNPIANLANLATHYNKIIIPIHFLASKQDFEYGYGMRVETIIREIKANKDRYVPVVCTGPRAYRGVGFYDEIFEVCRSLYDCYPPFIGPRSHSFQGIWATLATVHRPNIPPERAWMEAKRKFPELDIGYVANTEVEDLTACDRRGLGSLARELKVDSVSVKKSMATCLHSLRVFGHGDLAQLLLDFHKATRDLSRFHDMVDDYHNYLVSPIVEELGGFANYTTKDLEKMVSLRVLPLMRRDVTRLAEENRRLYLNAPGARSPITLESYKMNVFLRGGDDIATLNKLWEISESHKKQAKVLAEYRSHIATGNLPLAHEAFMKAAAVFSQISDEVKAWQREERNVKLGAYTIAGGAMILSDIALILGGGLPEGWRLVIALFKDVMAMLGLKDLDPKRIVEWIYGVKNWPWYEKGVPYLYWKAEKKT